jgi:hypothetical protein
MPQASAELQAEWPGYDSQATAHLFARGYKLHRDASWSAPSQPDHEVTDRDKSAIAYLIDEWDYGGLRSDRNDR